MPLRIAELHKELRLARKIITTLVKDRIHYPTRLVADTLIMAARCGLLLILYWYVFQLRGGSVNNTSYIFVAWSMFMYFAFGALRFREIPRTIDQDIKSGSIEVLMNKPISYLLYRAWWQIGSGLYPFVVITLLGSVILAVTIGIPGTMTLGVFLPTLALVFLGCAMLSFLIYTMVGLMAFWIEDTNPLFWITDKTVMILGGSYLPIALFPPLMYKIALYSPFGASQFVTHTVYTSWQNTWPLFVLTQLFWILVLGAATTLLYQRAQRKVSVNGG